jgi:acyl carrier protein
MSNGTLEKIAGFIAEQFKVSPDSVKPETDLARDLHADSLDLVQMLMTLEEQFGISVDEDAAMRLKVVGDLVNYIDSQK